MKRFPIYRLFESRLINASLLMLSMALTLLAYWPGLGGTYLFDDYPNIVNNLPVGITDLSFDSLWEAALSGHSGPLGRPISMISFALNYYYSSGLNPFYLKFTNLLIHLANGIGLYVLSNLLLHFYQRRFQPLLTDRHITWICLGATAAWLLHPFNVSSILYIVQRMTSLSSFFCIWGLVVYVWGRSRLYEGKSGRLAILSSFLIFTPLAILSKEFGALLPLFILVVEITFFKFACQDKYQSRWLKRIYIFAVGLPALAALAYVAAHAQSLLYGYIARDFTSGERLMTEARVIWFYISQIILPSTAKMGLYHDDILISRSLLQPYSTLPSILGILALIGVAIVFIKRAPALTFGILFFLTGHLIESTVLPLELAFEHRNYLPMFGIMFIMFFYLLHPAHVDTLWIRRGLGLLLIGLLAFATLMRAQQWANPFDFATIEATHHPNSARSNIAAGSAYQNFITDDPVGMERNYLFARYYYEKAINIDKNSTMAFVNLLSLSYVRNKPIDPSWMNELTYRFEHAPFAAEMTTQLRLIIDCQTKSECKFTNQELSNLFEAAFRNPTLTGANRASVYLAQSFFMTNIMKDYNGGLVALHNMISAAPSVLENRMTFINYLVAMKRFPEAENELVTLESMNKGYRFKKEIANYKDMLMKSHQKYLQH